MKPVRSLHEGRGTQAPASLAGGMQTPGLSPETQHWARLQPVCCWLLGPLLTAPPELLLLVAFLVLGVMTQLCRLLSPELTPRDQLPSGRRLVCTLHL